MNIKKYSKDYLIFKSLAGSYAYGTNIETSDIDTRGIFIAPPKVSIGCMYTAEQFLDDTQDEQIFELGKFTRLAANANPNLLEILFSDEKNIQFIDPIFNIYREHASMFLSKKAKHTFSGYAMSQLKRIKGHNKWINNPQPEKEPTLSQFIRWIDEQGFDIKPPDKTIWLNEFTNRHIATRVNEHIYKVYQTNNVCMFKPGIISSTGQNIKYIDIDFEKIDMALQEGHLEFRGMLFVAIDEFKTAHTQWQQYWTWKRERNPQRAALEEKFQIDTKHASHLVRLLRMGEEILKEGKVIVHRPDSEELKAIRNGAWTYEQLVNWAEAKDAELSILYETSTLPHTPDIEKINELYIETILKYWKEKKLL